MQTSPLDSYAYSSLNGYLTIPIISMAADIHIWLWFDMFITVWHNVPLCHSGGTLHNTLPDTTQAIQG